jgi:hypothetical protein
MQVRARPNIHIGLTSSNGNGKFGREAMPFHLICRRIIGF